MKKTTAKKTGEKIRINRIQRVYLFINVGQFVCIIEILLPRMVNDAMQWIQIYNFARIEEDYKETEWTKKNEGTMNEDNMWRRNRGDCI